MVFSRRMMLAAGLAAPALAATSIASPARAGGRRDNGKTFVLVHGAWISSFSWQRVIPFLVAAGHTVIARDLPGHGVNARFPDSYLRRPLDVEAFSTEVSPVADVTLEDLVTSIAVSIRSAVEGGSGPVILVSQTPHGVATTVVAERYPEYIANLVHLSDFMPDVGISAVDYTRSPEDNNGASLFPLFFGDPATTGALRIDYNSEDPAYLAALQNVRYNDVDPTTIRALINLSTPDSPVQIGSAPTVKTVDRWGRVPRTYIRTLQDHSTLPALQNRFIREADAFSPQNLTVVRDLDASNSSWISQPRALARVLLDVADSVR